MCAVVGYSPLDTSTAITFPTCPASVLRGVQPGWDQTWGGAGGWAEREDIITRAHTTHTHTHMGSADLGTSDVR